jgi:hypothetical protein
MAFQQVQPGDHATLRKPHPCGGFEWVVTRVGADIGLECVTCGRRVMLDREEFERRLKRLDRAEGNSSPSEESSASHL